MKKKGSNGNGKVQVVDEEEGAPKLVSFAGVEVAELVPVASLHHGVCSCQVCTSDAGRLAWERRKVLFAPGVTTSTPCGVSFTMVKPPDGTDTSVVVGSQRNFRAVSGPRRVEG